MMPCSDLSQLLHFCEGEPVRYRHLLHRAQGLYPELDRATDELLDVSGSPALYCDLDTGPALVACAVGGSLQLEGEPSPDLRSDLAAWCHRAAPRTVITTSPALRGILSEGLDIQPDRWQSNGEYTVTEDDFSPRITRPVRLLTPDDEPMWRRFLTRHAEDMSIWSGLGAGSLEFDLMAKGLPVDVYVTEYEGQITGMLSVRPLTRECDEVSMVFVDQEHRRRGNAHSMLSEAAHDILERGRVPGYSAIGNRDELVSMLEALGFLFITHRWIARLDRAGAAL